MPADYWNLDIDDAALIDRAASIIGVSLLPWQRAAAAAMLRPPSPTVVTRGRRGGWTVTQRVARAARDLEPGGPDPKDAL